jgi:phosphatidylglycerophosphatase A
MPARENVPADRGRPAPFLHRFIATGAFSGYLPWAPGTAGSLVGLLLYLIPGASAPAALGAMILAGFFAGRAAAARVAESTGHRLSAGGRMTKNLFQRGRASHPDPSIVVIDEIVGMWIALLLLPKTLPALLIAFTTFRIFDIVKPPPAADVEHFGSGWGIMLDDVVAGMYAGIVTHLTLRIIG